MYMYMCTHACTLASVQICAAVGLLKVCCSSRTSRSSDLHAIVLHVHVASLDSYMYVQYTCW